MRQSQPLPGHRRHAGVLLCYSCLPLLLPQMEGVALTHHAYLQATRTHRCKVVCRLRLHTRLRVQYKENKDLPAEAQIITAMPEIKSLALQPDTDEFLVLACDGVWNCMESQQCIDHVRTELGKGTKLTTICEQICDLCCADSTEGDGTVSAQRNALICLAAPDSIAGSTR
eukprot:SAG11_NODE_2254_length_3625_cov_2.484118_6_plen_171_part_00